MTLRDMISRQVHLTGVSFPGESVFFKPKIWLTPRNINQNRKYINPLVSGLGRIE